MNAGVLPSDTIFLSYRRDDAAFAAGWVCKRLRSSWPGDAIFLDVDSIRAGDDFPERLRNALDCARVVLACIGPRWLCVQGADGRRRLDDPEDFVRREIEHGLARASRGECQVIPVFIDGMHGFESVSGRPETQLPDAIAGLATKNAVFIRRPPDTDPDITGLIEQLAAILGVALPDNYADPLPAALHQLPSPPVDFTGRVEELRDLLAEVRTGSAVVVGLQGMGGLGKTALAVKIAHELKADYPDAQIFLDLKGVDLTEHSHVRQKPLSPADVMWHVVTSFHPELKRPDSEAGVESAYRTLLNGTAGAKPKRAILLFDNARDDKQLRPLLPPPSCLLLATSRQRFDLPGMHRQDLASMNPQEAVELLLVIAPRIGSYASKLAELCGCLPLALELIARALNKRDDLTPEEVIERLGAPRSPLKWKELQEVEGSFSVSYELLSDDLQKIWRALAVFPGPFDTAAAAAIWDFDTIQAKDHVVELRGYSLLEWDKETNRYSLHDLARHFADERLTDERHLVQRRHARHYQQVLSRAEDLYLSGGDGVTQGLHLCELEWGNIRTGQAWASCHVELDDEAAQLCMNYPSKAFNTLRLRLHPRDHICWSEVGLNAARKFQDQRAESVALGHLGVSWSDMGDSREAIEYYEQALAIARSIGDRQAQGIHLGNLGNAWFELSDAQAAIAYHGQALAIARETRDRRREGCDLLNLGNAWSFLGDPSKAVEYYEQALAIAREIGNRRAESQNIGLIGSVWIDLGDARKAFEYYEQALAIAREIGDRKTEGVWFGHLGTAWEHLGDAHKAIEYYEQALAIAREIGERINEGACLLGLGNAWSQLSDAYQAIEYYEQALAIAREIGDRRGESQCLGNLANRKFESGDADKATEYYEQALAIAKEIGDHRDEGLWLGHLGRVRAASGDAPGAIVYYEQALAIAQETGDHRREGHWLSSLGGSWFYLDNARKAIEYYNQSLAIARNNRDRRSEGSGLCSLGHVHADVGEKREAINYYEQALAIHRDLGDNASERAVLNTLGFTHALWGRRLKGNQIL